jgi:hypothetical protein
MQAIPRSYTAWLVPVTFMLLGFGLNPGKASAQTSYPISSYYDTTIYVTPITSEISQVIESGVSTDAPYGLNEYDGLTYAKTNPTGELTFNIDATTFGLQDLPLGYITFGSGTNKIFGTSDATTVIDLENLTASGYGTVDITGGEGIFQNASGTLFFTEEDIIIPGEITTTLKGRALVYGSIDTSKTVPEPNTTTTLVGMGMIGVGLLVRRHRLKSASC